MNTPNDVVKNQIHKVIMQQRKSKEVIKISLSILTLLMEIMHLCSPLLVSKCLPQRNTKKKKEP